MNDFGKNDNKETMDVKTYGLVRYFTFIRLGLSNYSIINKCDEQLQSTHPANMVFPPVHPSLGPCPYHMCCPVSCDIPTNPNTSAQECHRTRRPGWAPAQQERIDRRFGRSCNRYKKNRSRSR